MSESAASDARPRVITIRFDNLPEQADEWLTDTLSQLVYGCPWLPDALITSTQAEASGDAHA